MYKFFTFFIILLVTLTLNLPAQSFKASDGLSKAQSTTTLPNPELWGIGTIDTTVMSIAVKFDMSTGTSNAWLYVFHSRTTDSLKICGVTYFLGSLFGYEVPASSGYDILPFKPTKTLSGFTWIDSDVMAQKLRDNSEYKSFKMLRPNQQLKLTK